MYFIFFKALKNVLFLQISSAVVVCCTCLNIKGNLHKYKKWFLSDILREQNKIATFAKSSINCD